MYLGANDIATTFMFQGRLFAVSTTGSIYRYDGDGRWTMMSTIYV